MRRLYGHAERASREILYRAGVVQADGGEVLTVEGLEKDGQLHPLQEGFWEEHGLQCGYCTPGMIMVSYQLLQRNPNPTDEQIRHGLEGNLCRCTWKTFLRLSTHSPAVTDSR